MYLNRTLTSSVYIVNNNKVLLHMHKKYNTLFPVGGKMEANEVPHETALREVLEESGLKVELYNDNEIYDLGRVEQLIKPMHVLLENIGHEVENIDFIYFAKSKSDKLEPLDGESKEFYWFSKDDIIENDNIKPHIKSMALNALKILGQ